MPASDRLVSHLKSTYYAPRGRGRMYDLGIQLSQLYLLPSDKLIGIMGDPGSGKSAVVKGMFPGLELSNDDDGVNVRPLPILSAGEANDFFSPHTYHVDIRFECAFTQMHILADAIMSAIKKGKRVAVEHFELIYPMLPINADLLIGIGEEVIISRPGIFGPEPREIYDTVHASLPYRLMAHTAEDLCEFFMKPETVAKCTHGDVRHGFTMSFRDEMPDVSLAVLEENVNAAIASDLPVSYADETHINIGPQRHFCTGPRIHVVSTGKIVGFRLLPEFVHDRIRNCYILVGCVGEDSEENIRKLEKMRRQNDEIEVFGRY